MALLSSFGWTFLAAKISRKSPSFCNKFCNRKKPLSPCDHGAERTSSYHPNLKCTFCSDADTVGESFELNIIAAQEAGTLTGTVRPIAIDQGSVPGKLNFGHCRTP
jgi:hypothetical protein